MGELTGAKIGANVANKIVVQMGTLTIHTTVEIDTLDVLTAVETAEEDDSVADDEGCSSVDEVVDTSIDDTWICDVVGVDDKYDVDAIKPAKADSNLDDVTILGGE